MELRPTLIPLVGALALVPIVVYLLARPELGALLSVVSTGLIVTILIFMLRPEREDRGKVFGTPR